MMAGGAIISNIRVDDGYLYFRCGDRLVYRIEWPLSDKGVLLKKNGKKAVITSNSKTDLDRAKHAAKIYQDKLKWGMVK